METKTYKSPAGIQPFSGIRKGNRVFVDKSRQVNMYNIINL
jgi:hypothetical protein